MLIKMAAVGFGLVAIFACSAAIAQKGKPSLELNADGEVQIAPDGHVADYRLKSQLAPEVASLVDRDVRGWKFEPIVIDGQPVTARTSMHIRIQAAPIDGDNYKLQIQNVNFGDSRPVQGTMRPPHYPDNAIRARVGGRVLLAVRIDENGNVVDAQPFQTSLDARARDENEAERHRRMLEGASIDAARNWHFSTTDMIGGKPIGKTVMIPIVYSLRNAGEPPPNDAVWKSYLPGPVHSIPWLHDGQPKNGDEFVPLGNGQGQALGSPFKLKDSVIGKAL